MASNSTKPHVLLLPYPSQGHITPILQFAKRLASIHNLQTSLALPRFLAASTPPEPNNPVSVHLFSDGFDRSGPAQAPSISAYLSSLESVGSQTLSDLIESLRAQSSPVRVLIYDAFLPWGLDVANRLGLRSAAFLTQSGAVEALYWYAKEGRIVIPASDTPLPPLPGLVPLEPRDLPSFLTDREPGRYPAYLALLLDQFRSWEKMNVMLVNSFHELEHQVFDWMNTLWRVRPVGPTIPSAYLDGRIPSDTHYGFNLFAPDSDPYLDWLDSKLLASVIYVSFGSTALLTPDQFEELASGLASLNKHFLWAVRKSELAKLPKHFIQDTSDRGLVVTWCNQLGVLAHRAVGCFVTHCGWNSTTEAIGLGVPMVGVPQYSDQTTNAKHLEDVWGVGVRVKEDEKGVVRKEELVRCVKEVMEGERSVEIRKNAAKWKMLAKGAVSEGGSSDKNIVEFVNECCF